MSVDSPSTITEYVGKIDELRDEAEEIERELAGIEEKKRKATNKNEQFEKLQEKLAELDQDRQKLETYLELAGAMGLEIDTAKVKETIRDVGRHLQELIEASYDDFEDSMEVRDIQDRVDEAAEFGDHIQSIQQTIANECKKWLEEIDRTQTILQIPDVGPDPDSPEIQRFKTLIKQILKGKDLSRAVNKWEEYIGEYQDIDVSLDEIQESYELGDVTLEIIRELLEGDPVTVSDLNTDVLADMKKLSEFSDDLAISFTNNE